MKKTILTFVVMAFAVVSFAQKPSDGNLVTEANFNLSNFNNNFTLPSLRFRYFTSSDMAFRVDLGVNGNSTTNNFIENADGTGGTGDNVVKNSSVNIGIGVEKHFGGNNRFSPFVGAQVNYGMGSSTSESSNSNGSSYIMDYSVKSEAKNSGFGVMAIAGADYWIGNSFYVGTEINFGFRANTQKEGTNEVTISGTTTKTVNPERKSSGFGQGITPAFRIGFILK
ncbi:MAG: hypothetical protein COA58_11930 [Bacteroidetes bacterium]|nr:MAG: hypothetical protein COA58_11930 [Bacteroidota bacterium]